VIKHNYEETHSEVTTTTGNGFVAVRHAGTAKGINDTAKALSCVDTRQRPHNNAISGNGSFAVRHGSALAPLSCGFSLLCA
jgi:hypothetical protein